MQAAEVTAPYSPCTSRQRRRGPASQDCRKDAKLGVLCFPFPFKGPWAGVSQCLILTQSHSRSLVSPNTELSCASGCWGKGGDWKIKDRGQFRSL